MQVYSFFEHSFGLKKTKVEISLIPGLPEFKITGMPDSSLRESLLRIKSALVVQGFQLPQTHQVLINLDPPFEKKKSKGLELAIACAYLWYTEQVPMPERDIFVYGGLSLNGEVNFLHELSWAEADPGADILTGLTEECISFSRWSIRNLKELHSPVEEISTEQIKAPKNLRQFSDRKWPVDLARRMAAIVLGQHHTLLAGPAGSGKSTLSKALHNLLPDLRGQALTELIRWNRFFSRDEVTARPLAQPHHTASAFAVLGGGKPIVPGEMSKAHLGMLILDEFLEFNSAVREGLREPLESGVIHLARQGQGECIPADFVLVATTNLCPCGDFIPNDPRVRCPRSLRQCRSYLDRLSGPVADRFDVLIFSNDWQRTGVVTEKEIFAMVETGRENQLKMNPRSQANGRLFENELHSHLEKPNLKDFLPASGKSRRRNQSVLRVARTLADLDGSEAIKLCHLNEAIDLAWRPFQTMRKAHI